MKKTYKLEFNCYNCGRENYTKEIPFGKDVMRAGMAGFDKIINEGFFNPDTPITCPHCGSDKAIKAIRDIECYGRKEE